MICPRVARCVVLMLGLGGCADEDVRPDPPRAVPEAAPLAPVAKVETLEIWQDLLAQRPSAVILRDGALDIDLGRENAIKHVALGFRDTWSLTESAFDRQAGIVRGLTGALEIPLDGELSPALHPDVEAHSGLAIAITVRALGPGQSVTVLWNEQPLANLNLAPEWERRTLSLPAAATRVGENRLRLHFRRAYRWNDHQAAAAVERIEVGTHEQIVGRADVPTLAPYRIEGVLGEAAGAMVVPPGASLAWYVIPPSRGKLRVHARGEGALEVLVSANADHEAGRPPTRLLDEPLRPTGRNVDLDLSAWSRAPLRLELKVRGTAGKGGASVESLALVNKRTARVDHRERVPRSIVVLAVEGARADALGWEGKPALPNFERLRAGAVVFERAYALSSAAVPSHAAILASGVPPVHLTVRGTYLADGQTLLAEALSRGGYFRSLVTANPDLSAERGLRQGFDLAKIAGGPVTGDHASAVVTAVLATVRDRERWFAYANVNDPQAPYEPARELLRDLHPPANAPLAHQTRLWVSRVRAGKIVPTPAELNYVKQLYRGELGEVDRALGAVLDASSAQSRELAPVVVVTGVHGEEFFEHGGAGHGRTLEEESLRVPLFISAPGLLAPGRVDAAVDLLDLAPTIVDLVGAPAADTWQGESLVPVIDDPEPPLRLIVGFLGDGSRVGVVDGFKLFVGPGRAEAFEVLDSGAVRPDEGLPRGGIELRLVRSALGWQLAHETRWRRARWGTGANLRPAFAMDLGM